MSVLYKDVIPKSSNLHGFWRIIFCNSYHWFFVHNMLFSLAAFIVFSLCLVFSNLTMMCVKVCVCVCVCVWYLFYKGFSEVHVSVICCLSLVLKNSWPLSLQIFPLFCFLFLHLLGLQFYMLDHFSSCMLSLFFFSFFLATAHSMQDQIPD